jgi:hypothetical protein
MAEVAASPLSAILNAAEKILADARKIRCFGPLHAILDGIEKPPEIALATRARRRD